MTTDKGFDALRALWQRQSGSSFSMEPDEIRKRLSQFQAELRDDKILAYTLYSAMAILFAYGLIFTTQAIITRVGFLLLVLGMSFWVGQVWLYNRDRQKALVNSDAAGQTSCVEFYRAELLRQRNFYRGAWLWSRMLALFAGLVFVFMGWEPLHHWHGSGNASRAVNLLIVSTGFILGVWGSYRSSRRLQRKIDAIDAMKQPNEAGPS